MGKLGIRSESGPFDWYFSDFDSVLKCIESDFIDFMKPENLYVSQDNNKVFVDSKYNFICNHDIIDDFCLEIETICEKYHIRAQRFIQKTKLPTMFFRAVRSNAEIEYIKENEKYIDSVIKKNNSQNQICFIILREMPDLPNSFLWFRLYVDEYVIGNPLELRNMFSCNSALQEMCLELIDKATMKKNISFDKMVNQSKINAGLGQYFIKKNSKTIIEQLKEYLQLKATDIFYVWGYGINGVSLVDYLRDKINVYAIIDSDKNKSVSGEVSIISPGEIRKGGKILISLEDKRIVKNIIRQINSFNLDLSYMTWEDFLLDESQINIEEIYEFTDVGANNA